MLTQMVRSSKKLPGIFSKLIAQQAIIEQTWSGNQNFLISRSWDNFASKHAKNVANLWR